MTEKKRFFQKRQESPRAIARKIKAHLGDDTEGTFRLGDTLITMSTRPSNTHVRGNEFSMRIHSPVPDTPLFASHGVSIVIFDRGNFVSPQIHETLTPTIHKGITFDTWDAGKQYHHDDLTENKPPLHPDYKPELTEYAQMLHDPLLKRVGPDADDRERERIISDQVKRRAEILFEMAVSREKEWRSLAGHKQVDPTSYAPTFQIGGIEAILHYIPGKIGRRGPSYKIDFLPGEDADWEIYSFNKQGILVLRTDVIKGKEVVSRVPYDKGSQLASTLEQFDENNIIK